MGRLNPSVPMSRARLRANLLHIHLRSQISRHHSYRAQVATPVSSMPTRMHVGRNSMIGFDQHDHQPTALHIPFGFADASACEPRNYQLGVITYSKDTGV